MKFKKFIIVLLSVIITFSTLLIGCGTKKASSDSSKNIVLNNKQKVWREIGSWSKPPLYQGNYFASGGLGWPTSALVCEGLYQFIRSTDYSYPRLADGMPKNDGNKTTIKLKKGVTWNDGKPFTSKDIWAYYTLNNGEFITTFLKSIEIPDNDTIVFIWNDPQINEKLKTFLIAQSTQATIPYHIYSKYIDKAAQLLKEGKQAASIDKRGPFGIDLSDDKTLNDALTRNWQDFVKDTPKMPIGTGPYKVVNVTASDMILEKRSDYWNKKAVPFDKVILKQVPDTAGQLAMLKSGKLEHFDGTQAKDILESMLKSNKDLVHYTEPDPADMGFVFDIQKPPFNNIDFRRALIYIFDKDKIREIGNYYGESTTGYSVMGMPISIVNQYLTPEVKSKMTKFKYDPDEAKKELQAIGWTKGTDGLWKDKNGKSYNFVIGANSGWASNANSAEICAEQLKNFGLPTKLMAVDSSIYYTNAQTKHAYDMSSDWIDVTWGFNYPWWPLSNFYTGSPSDEGNFPRVTSGAEKGKLNMVLRGPEGKSVDVDLVLKQMLYMNDDDVKKAASDLVWIANENAFGLDWFQNVTGDWFNMKTLKMKGGWLFQDLIKKYDRNIPVLSDPKGQEALGKLHFNNFLWLYGGYDGDMSLMPN